MSEFVTLGEKVECLLGILSLLRRNQPLEYVLSLPKIQLGDEVIEKGLDLAFFSKYGIVSCIHEKSEPLTERVVLAEHGKFLETFYAGHIFEVVTVLDFLARVLTSWYSDRFDPADQEFVDAVEISAFILVEDGKKVLNTAAIDRVLTACQLTSRAG